MFNAGCDVKSCYLEYHKSADLEQEPIQDLHASLSTEKQNIETLGEPFTHLVDRRHVQKHNNAKMHRPDRDKGCFVCKRPQC